MESKEVKLTTDQQSLKTAIDRIEERRQKAPSWQFRNKGSMVIECFGDPAFASKRLSPPADGLILEYLGKVKENGLVIIQGDGSRPRPIGYGKVLAVGPGKKTTAGLIPCDVKVGDEVLYHYANATVMGVPDENGTEHEFIKINETQVLATFKND